MGYSTIESAVLVKLRTLSYYDDGNCLAENIGKAHRYTLAQKSTSDLGKNFCAIDYAGGRPSDEMYCWTHTIRGFCAALVTEENPDVDLTPVGTQVRQIIEDIQTLFYPNNRLSGASPRCTVTEMTDTFPYSRTNTNWLAFFFTLEVDEERDRC